MELPLPGKAGVGRLVRAHVLQVVLFRRQAVRVHVPTTLTRPADKADHESSESVSCDYDSTPGAASLACMEEVGLLMQRGTHGLTAAKSTAI